MVNIEKNNVRSNKMGIFEAIFLGIIQGITEFLPVSSSGHLTLFQKIFNIHQATMTFDVLLHVATLIAVFVVYWEDIWALMRKPFQKTTYLLVAATLPTVVMALLFSDTFESVFGNGDFIGFNFIFTAIVLTYADTRHGRKGTIDRMSYKDAVIVGTMQGIAICPAISRSGMTISASLARGLNRDSAARFSFLLSIPAILGAMVLTLKDIFTGEVVIAEAIGTVPMVAGFIAAAISGYLSIKFMIKIVKKGKLRYFGLYTFILGVYLILDQFVLHIIY